MVEVIYMHWSSLFAICQLNGGSDTHWSSLFVICQLNGGSDMHLSSIFVFCDCMTTGKVACNIKCEWRKGVKAIENVVVLKRE